MGVLSPELAIAPLEAPFGALVTGLDFGSGSPEVRNRVKLGLMQHHALICRGQRSPSVEDLRTFFGPFGALTSSTHEGTRHYRQVGAADAGFADASGLVPEAYFVSNVIRDGAAIGGLGDIELDWHNDQIYLPRAKTISLLEAIDVSPEVSPTYLCDMYSACEALSHTMRSRLERATAVHPGSGGYQRAAAARGATDDVEGVQFSSSVHPVLKQHPDTGRRAVYVNRGHTGYIVGLSDAESDELLGEIFAHSYREEFIYEHRWQPGDILIWDNLGLQHRRDDLDPSLPRTLRAFQGVSEVLV